MVWMCENVTMRPLLRTIFKNLHDSKSKYSVEERRPPQPSPSSARLFNTSRSLESPCRFSWCGLRACLRACDGACDGACVGACVRASARTGSMKKDLQGRFEKKIINLVREKRIKVRYWESF
jgi:hypothetical protein